jgi:phospholipid/cholesterol/gamma-HCH transport system substrate-binding protein
MHAGARNPVLMATHRSLRARWPAAVALAAAVLVGLCGSCAPLSQSPRRAEYCAIMPDATGLYIANPVTQMGYQIGKVTAITPGMRNVRVDFTVTERRLPQDVKAVLRSSSVLADRSLELVGNYSSGPELAANGCIPLDRAFTPKSLSETIGAATDLINSINPADSNNVGDVVKGVDQTLQNQGVGINHLVTTASTLLNSPDQAIGDIGSSIQNLAQLTTTFKDLEPTLKGVLQDVDQAGPGVVGVLNDGDGVIQGLISLIPAAADLESQLGGEIQQTLDSVSVVVRKLSPRAPYYASLLNVTPRLINGLGNFIVSRQNSGAAALTIRYRPPLYRIRTPDGAFQCGYMNAAVPGSCANINGMPYAVDVALLQYVLMRAAGR